MQEWGSVLEPFLSRWQDSKSPPPDSRSGRSQVARGCWDNLEVFKCNLQSRKNSRELKKEEFKTVKAVEVEEGARVKARIKVSVPMYHIVLACYPGINTLNSWTNRGATLID